MNYDYDTEQTLTLMMINNHCQGIMSASHRDATRKALVAQMNEIRCLPTFTGVSGDDC